MRPVAFDVSMRPRGGSRGKRSRGRAGRVAKIPSVPRTMSLARSRERAAAVFDGHNLHGLTWRQLRDQHGFTSIGATQLAYQRHLDAHPMPGPESTRAAIVERKQLSIGLVLKSLRAAAEDQDHGAVAMLVNALTKADAELAKLYGLSRESLDVKVQLTPTEVIDRAERELLELAAGRAPADDTVLRWSGEEARV